MPLSSIQLATLTPASRPQTESIFRELQTHFSKQNWVGIHNRYGQDTVNRLKADLGANPPVINHIQLAKYIAASSVLHCLDGWGFLGRALMAGSYGDSDIALHLA